MCYYSVTIEKQQLNLERPIRRFSIKHLPTVISSETGSPAITGNSDRNVKVKRCLSIFTELFFQDVLCSIHKNNKILDIAGLFVKTPVCSMNSGGMIHSKAQQWIKQKWCRDVDCFVISTVKSQSCLKSVLFTKTNKHAQKAELWIDTALYRKSFNLLDPFRIRFIPIFSYVIPQYRWI